MLICHHCGSSQQTDCRLSMVLLTEHLDRSPLQRLPHVLLGSPRVFLLLFQVVDVDSPPPTQEAPKRKPVESLGPLLSNLSQNRYSPAHTGSLLPDSTQEKLYFFF